jgi:hypothetical protein
MFQQLIAQKEDIKERDAGTKPLFTVMIPTRGLKDT